MEWASQTAELPLKRRNDVLFIDAQPFVVEPTLFIPWQMDWAYPSDVPMDWFRRKMPPELMTEYFSTVDSLRGRHEWHARGLYRVFNAVGYRFYKGTVASPPTEATVPFATSATLPATPADTFGDDSHLISVSYFNGALDSGFLPVGVKGERFFRMDIAAGVQVNAPPDAPQDVRLAVRAGGVVRVVALSLQSGDLRPTQWAITYTTNGSTPGEPPAVSPTVTVVMPPSSSSAPRVLSYDLPAQANGTTVKVRVQTRRQDGATWYYSEGSSALTALASTTGPTASVGGDMWPGQPTQAG